MNNVQFYNPAAPVSSYAPDVRFRPSTPHPKPSGEIASGTALNAQPGQTIGFSELLQRPATIQGQQVGGQKLSVEDSGIHQADDVQAVLSTPTEISDVENDISKDDSVESERDTDDSRSLRSLFSADDTDCDSSAPETGLECEPKSLEAQVSDGRLREDRTDSLHARDISSGSSDRQRPTDENTSTVETEQRGRDDSNKNVLHEMTDNQQSASLDPKDRNLFRSQTAEEHVQEAASKDSDHNLESPGQSSGPSKPTKQHQASTRRREYTNMKGAGPRSGQISTHDRDGSTRGGAAKGRKRVVEEAVSVGENNHQAFRKRQRTAHDTRRTNQTFNPFRSSISLISSSDDESDQACQRPSKATPIRHSTSAMHRRAQQAKSMDLDTSPHSRNEEDHNNKYSYESLVGYRRQNGMEEVEVLWPRQKSWEPASNFLKEEVARVKCRTVPVSKTPMKARMLPPSHAERRLGRPRKPQPRNADGDFHHQKQPAQRTTGMIENQRGTSIHPTTMKCPYCRAEVPRPATYLERRMNLSEQREFCLSHKKDDARRQWNEQGYPPVQWEGLESRICQYDPPLRELLEGGRPSSFRSAIEAAVARNERARFRGMDQATAGYYGPRGHEIMSEHIISRFAPILRRTAVSDDLLRKIGVAEYVATVLAPELAIMLVKDDMGLDDEGARKVLENSKDIGFLLHSIDG